MIALRILLLLPFLVLLVSTGHAARQTYPDRWFYVARNLTQEQDAADIEAVVNTAADHGLNGMLFSGRLDALDLCPPEYFTRLERVKASCARRGVEIIPSIFSVGYAGSILAHDRNLAAGLPVVDAPFMVRGGEARLAPEEGALLTNGGFEEWDANRLKGYVFNDRPGEVTVPDEQVLKEGRRSIRLQRAGELDPRSGHARILQEVALHPNRQYRVSAWVRTQDLQPSSAFRMQVYANDRVLAPADLGIPSTTEWRQVEMRFNSGVHQKVRLYAGLWGARQGTAWIDALKVEELGLCNVVRRPGTPLSVRSADGRTSYEEGRDFAPVSDPDLLRAHADPQGPPLRTLPGSRIREGDRLRVSFYHAVSINRGQVTACMSEPKLYEIWREQARLIQKHLAPRKWHLAVDEIRAGGSCAACKARGLSMGRILGDCITRQVAIIREVAPKAEIYCWSDMLDPAHNAHGNYYMVDGDFTGSWEHVPKDLIIACWWHEKREESLRFFSERGFRTLGAAYYDGDDLQNCRDWLEALARTPKATGIMYTTWQNKYALLGPFGDLVRGDQNE